MIRVAVVDDQALMRAGFRALLDAEEGIEVVGEAADGQQGVDLVRAQLPDIALIDVQMPVMTGIEATRRIAADPDSPPKPGIGLTGMRERVTALGGTLHTAPRAEGGFSVRAELPLGETG